MALKFDMIFRSIAAEPLPNSENDPQSLNPNHGLRDFARFGISVGIGDIDAGL